MAKDRLSLHSLLSSILNTTNVYFQPPSTITMKYPCIIYKLDKIDATHANDKKYFNAKRYLITVVDKDPDTIIPSKILELPFSEFEKTFVVENLNHYVCSLYY